MHEPDIDKFAQLERRKEENLTEKDALGSLLSDAALKTAVETFAAIGLTATVGEAGSQLRAKAECKDVFVTSGGRETDKVLGWLTNSDLARVE